MNTPSSSNVAGFETDRFGVLFSPTALPVSDKIPVERLYEMAIEKGCHSIRGELDVSPIFGDGDCAYRLTSIATGGVGFVIPMDVDRDICPEGATFSISVSVLLWKKGEDGSRRVLIVKCKNRGYWAGVAGGIKNGEKIKKAIAREVEEETSLKINVDTIKHIAMTELYDYFNGDKNHGGNVLHTFSAELEGSDIPELQKDELEDSKWVDQSTYNDMVTFETAKKAADAVFNGRGNEVTFDKNGKMFFCV